MDVNIGKIMQFDKITNVNKFNNFTITNILQM